MFGWLVYLFVLYAIFLPVFVFAEAPDSFDFLVIIFVCSTLLDKTDEVLSSNPFFFFQIVTVTMPLPWPLLNP